MIPIEKNVLVVDEQGNEYEATYPKRAKGLVKKGRARFIEENKICLACPPNEYLEDKDMENTNIKSGVEFAREQIEKLVAVLEKPNIAGDSNVFCNPQLFSEATAMISDYLEKAQKVLETPNEPTMQYVLSRIDRILQDTEHIHNAINSIKEMPVNDSPMGGSGDSSKADAIGNTVQSRETTNQQLIKFLEKMYDDLKVKNQPQDMATDKLHQMMDLLKEINWEEYPESSRSILEQAITAQMTRHY